MARDGVTNRGFCEFQRRRLYPGPWISNGRHAESVSYFRIDIRRNFHGAGRACPRLLRSSDTRTECRNRKRYDYIYARVSLSGLFSKCVFTRCFHTVIRCQKQESFGPRFRDEIKNNNGYSHTGVKLDIYRYWWARYYAVLNYLSRFIVFAN